MRILMTGSRAPVTLDLSRRFYRDGHTVMHADSLPNGIGMRSRSASKAFLVPRPVDSPRTYSESLASIVDNESIDWLIPTCEEVFYIAAYRSLLNCDVLIDDFDKLARIHNKWEFSQFAGDDFAAVPETILWRSSDEPGQCVKEKLPAGEVPADWVFKPVYSRFASRTLIGPTLTDLQRLKLAADELWIAQRRIRGVEYSTYSVASDGELLAHVTYQSLYRAGLGSGICFGAVRIPAIEDFVRHFVQTENYTGQIGFDFIEDAGGRYWVLEGNPRATSGAHLFGIKEPLGDALLNVRANDDVLKPSSARPAMVEFAMPFWGLSDAVRSNRWLQFVPDMLCSRWTVMSLRDPGPALGIPRALWTIASIARREKRTLQQASTFDIEWNGEAL